ncbi:Unknown protein, partial [Striga hermonthica]
LCSAILIILLDFSLDSDSDLISGSLGRQINEYSSSDFVQIIDFRQAVEPRNSPNSATFSFGIDWDEYNQALLSGTLNKSPNSLQAESSQLNLFPRGISLRLLDVPPGLFWCLTRSSARRIRTRGSLSLHLPPPPLKSRRSPSRGHLDFGIPEPHEVAKYFDSVLPSVDKVCADRDPHHRANCALLCFSRVSGILPARTRFDLPQTGPGCSHLHYWRRLWEFSFEKLCLKLSYGGRNSQRLAVDVRRRLDDDQADWARPSSGFFWPIADADHSYTCPSRCGSDDSDSKRRCRLQSRSGGSRSSCGGDATASHGGATSRIGDTRRSSTTGSYASPQSTDGDDDQGEDAEDSGGRGGADGVVGHEPHISRHHRADHGSGKPGRGCVQLWRWRRWKRS